MRGGANLKKKDLNRKNGTKCARPKRNAVIPPSSAVMIFPTWADTTAKGRKTRQLILRAALSILVDEGYRAMSLRRVATKCKIRFGNLTYHYPTREELVSELLDSVLRGYEAGYEAISDGRDLCPEDRLVRLCRYTAEEIRSKQTTRLFPELWALSNHDKFVFERMHALYRRGIVPMRKVVEELRPDLSQDVCTALSLFICVSIEVLMVFAGFRKPFEPWIAAFESIASRCFVDLVKNVTAKEVGKLVPYDHLWFNLS